MKILEIYDSGEETFDRYTIVLNYFETPELLGCLCMSANPSHPQGLSQFGTCQPGSHLGKRIKFSDLPSNIQDHATHRIGSDKVVDLAPYKNMICEYLEDSEKSFADYSGDTRDAFEDFFAGFSVFLEYESRDTGESIEDTKAELYVAFVQLCEGA